MRFEKINVNAEHRYGIDYRIDGDILTVIYDSGYSLYELDSDGICWLLMSEDNNLNELIKTIEVSASDLLEFADLDVNSDYEFLNSDNLEDFENAIKNAVIKTYSTLWENLNNHPFKDDNLELLYMLKETKYFDFEFLYDRSILRAKFSYFNLFQGGIL